MQTRSASAPVATATEDCLTSDALAQGASAHAGLSARTGAKIAYHESGVRHTTTSLHARIRLRRSGGDDPCCEDLSRDKTECRAPWAWWPTSGGAQAGVGGPGGRHWRCRCRWLNSVRAAPLEVRVAAGHCLRFCNESALSFRFALSEVGHATRRAVARRPNFPRRWEMPKTVMIV